MKVVAGNARAACIVILGMLALAGCGSGSSAGEQAASGEDRSFRVFAVGYQHRIERVTSYARFRAAIREQFQTQIAPHLAAERPNLVVYPENQSLMAYLVGLRGVASRELLAGGDNAIAALAALAVPYAPQIALYNTRFPGLDSLGQQLQLALTDTLVRVVVQTFSELADEHDIYVAVGSNLAPYASVPADDPQSVLYRDPEISSGPAFRATAREVLNRNFFFGPDGERLFVQDKAYLVPIERERTTGLGLHGIEVDEIRVDELPFARVGTVISKDAWMPDVNDRLDQLEAELLIQPEAFSTWAVPGNDLWPPDKFQRGGWWMVQKHPGIQVNATPQLTGNFGDMTFDGQPLIAVDGGQGADGLCLLGQSPEPGWAAVGDWNELDEPPRALCEPTRRPEFEAVGRALRPGSGDPRENAYAESVAFADVTLPARPHSAPRVPRAGFASSFAVPGDATQLQPRLGAGVGDTWLSWVDYRRGPNQSIYTARLVQDAWTGVTAAAPRAVTEHDHFDNQWDSDLLVTPAGPRLAFIAFPTENWDVFFAAPNGGPVRVDDAERSGGTLRERGHSDPRVAQLNDGTLIAVWSDLRWPWVKPQIRIARSDDTGETWTASERVDGGPTGGDPAQLDARSPHETRGQAFPAVAVDGRDVWVAWQEMGPDGVPGIRTARSSDGARSFGPVHIFDDTAAAWRPALAIASGTPWLAYERADGAGGRRVAWRRFVGGQWSDARVADDSGPSGSRQRYASLVARADGGVDLVFDDDRAGDTDILALNISAEGSASPPRRVDDGPNDAHARVPDAVRLPDGRLLVAWQDGRGDSEKIRSAVAGR